MICVSSIFPAPIDEIWEKLQRLDTLQYIAFPYATFKPVGNTEMRWNEGEVSEFILRLFGFIPMGIHTIHVTQFSREDLAVYTREQNRHVSVWNHRIIIKKIDGSHCHYTDKVEINAGWKTQIVFLWSRLFYKHRQQKWLKLLRTK